MTQEAKYLASKYQGLLKEYGSLLEHAIEEQKKEYNGRIEGKVPEEIGLEYARRLAAKDALALLLKRLNSKADERN